MQYPYEVEYYYIAGGQVSRKEYVEIMLNKIGKEIFAKYYYDFKREDNRLYTVITEDYTEKSKKRRTTYAISLIRQGLSEDALRNVACAKRLDPAISRLARAIYSCEFNIDLEI